MSSQDPASVASPQAQPQEAQPQGAQPPEGRKRLQYSCSLCPDRTFSQLGLPKEGSLARGKYNSLEYHVQTKHPQHDQTKWAELKLMKDAKFGKPSARYECALCDDGKVYHQKAETSSRKSVATLEGHVKEVHPAWEDDFLVLAIDKRAKPKQGSVSTGPGKDEKNPESRQTSVEAGTGEDENSHS